MKSLFILPLFLLLTFQLRAQDLSKPKLSKADSVSLATTWAKFKQALASKNKNEIQSLSLALIDCDLFEDPNAEVTQKDSFIPLDTFTWQFFQHMKESRLWSVVQKSKYHMSVWEFEDYHPRSIKLHKTKSLIVYLIWYVIWRPNEFAKGHEGQSQAFEFVKIKGEFKFYGMTSVP